MDGKFTVRQMSKGYLLFSFFFVHASLSAQQYAFDHITREEGLSQSTVFAITQDTEGFLWFGTRDGLNRYDARHIEVFRNDPRSKTSLSNNTIYSLYNDKQGRLWVGTQHGLNLYDPRQGMFAHFYSYASNDKTIPGNSVTCITEDKHQNLWVGTRQGLCMLPRGVLDTAGFIRFNHHDNNINSLVDNDVRSIFEDQDGDLWIGTTGGLSRLRAEGTNSSFSSFQLAVPLRQEKNNWVNAVLEKDERFLLVGTEKHGLKFFDKREEKFTPYPWKNADLSSKAVRTITRDAKGNFWIGTIGGLFILDSQTMQVLKLVNAPENPYSISDNSVRSMFIDRVGTYWIGTFHGGVNVFSPLARQFEFLRPGMEGRFKLQFKIASALVTDRHQNVWMGTEGNGLIFIDRKKNEAEYFRHEEKNENSLSHDNVKCLGLEEGKGIWIGTIKGLDFYDFGKQQFRHIVLKTPSGQIISDDAVYSLTKDKEERLWVGTYRGGLLLLNTSLNVFGEAYSYHEQDDSSISSDAVTSLLVDSKENMWIGTASGLNKREKDREQFIRYLHDPSDSLSIRGQYIYCIYEDSKGRLWVGTRDHGLSVFDGRVFRNFETAHGLSGNSVYGILEDDQGFLWISTENGISKFNTQLSTFTNFDRSDGLICKEFNFNSFHKDAKGYLYFGGYNGVTFFYPSNIRENDDVPPLAFTQLKVFNHEVKPSKEKNAILRQRLGYTPELSFRHDQNIFSIEFAVLNYVNARKNKFAYKLEGFEQDWNYVEEPVATYMNLEPGQYSLLVKGSNNDGVWNETPLALKLEVLPPPWKTRWAYALYTFIFFMLLYAWSRVSKKQVQLEHDLQLEHMEKQKQEELHQAKLNFFTNIAHEIRTPVTLMMAPIDQIREHIQDPFIKKEISLVKSNSDRLMRLLNQLLDFHRQETGNVKLKVQKRNFAEFILETANSFKEFSESRKINFNVDIAEREIPLWFDCDELTKVFCNLLANAFKFTPGGGEVRISVTRETKPDSDHPNDMWVRITISDNGLGIPSHHLEKIFHRFYQAENTGLQEAGFGIGLALAKGIIELHHGEITVESKEATHDVAGYTRFDIWLKDGNGHFRADQLYEELSYDALPGTEWNQESGRTGMLDPTDACVILVVEDNDEIRNYIVNVLKHHHYGVLQCRNGEEGWHTAVEKLPNLILSDVLMNVMNGLDMVIKLKNDERTSHIPIVLLTGRASLNHQVEGLITGADDYLTKPFNNQLLLAKIKNHLVIREKLKEKYSRIITINPQPEEVEDPDDKFLRKVMHLLETYLLDPHFNVTKLSVEIGMSRPVLFRKIKMLTGLSVIALIRSVRMKKAKMLLCQRKLTISEVAFAVGFNDPKYFSKSFHEHFGKSPSQFMEEIGGQVHDLDLKPQG
jgi:ligand-binding sensor domain-containing protein/signal transduction histidine kinase/DNA-binding response OmpR family regulator